jgi:outer membrane immunogenic protein
MKKHRIGLLAFTLTSIAGFASANAADVYGGPAGGGYKDGPWVQSWTGFYAGVHAGGASGDLKVTNLDHYTGVAKFTNSTDGAFGGGTFGLNLQRGNFVFGIEVDLGDMDLSNTKIQPGSPGGDTKSRISGGFYGDLTARLGYTTGAALLYAKGGFAAYNGHVEVFDNCNTGACGGALNQSNKGSLDGWTVGGGIEYMINPSWSIKAEYLHFDFGHETVTFVASPFSWKNELTLDSVKAGVNYHLGSGYEPLK